MIDAGLATIAPGCPTLIDLSLSIVSFIVGKGLSEIVYGLHILEKLDIFQCQIITDKYLIDFSKNCPNMNSLTTDSCSNIWNYSLKFVGKYCLNLKNLVLKNSPLIGDHGLAVLFYLACKVLTKVTL